MMKEIEGYPEYRINENGIVINKKGHVLKPAISNSGYLRLALERHDENGKLISRDNRSIHRLVAQTFINNPGNKPLVMHKDNDKLHDHALNLKWGTGSENIQQAFDEERKKIHNMISNKCYKCIYYVYNEDKSKVKKCKGREGVAEYLETNPENVKPGKISYGPFKDYIVENSHIICKSPISFIK